MKKTTQSETQKGIKNLEKSINNLYDKMESRFRNEIEHSITMEEVYSERFEAIEKRFEVIEKSLEEIKNLLKQKN
jgi:uncharacterized membrane protein YgaE (UPF0421/DUF939 family)